MRRITSDGGVGIVEELHEEPADVGAILSGPGDVEQAHRDHRGDAEPGDRDDAAHREPVAPVAANS